MLKENFNPLLFLLFVLLPSSLLFSQEKKDTIYFDEDWSICEQPVAAYYRVCELNKDKSIFYKGDVEDYYLNGQLEMKGKYNNKGVKEGDFIFYNKAGDTSVRGKYVDNHMSGNWFFYNSSGKLTTEINCKSEEDFTPLLIINSDGDTILKNGNGRFVLDIQKQLPNYLYGKKSYIIEGEVKNSLKDGNYNCYRTLPTKQLLFSANYKSGKLKTTQTEYNNIGSSLINVADYQYSLEPPNLVKIDQFNHTNFVFEYNYNAQSELINFLISNETPFIKAGTTNAKQNEDLIFDLIENVLYDTLMNPDHTKDLYYKNFKYPVKTYYGSAYSKSENYPKINADIILTVDTAGYIVNSVFSSNLTKQQINKMSYYFTHISNLAPYYMEDEKTMHNLDLKLDMLIDTLKNDSFHVNYLIYDADSAIEKDLTKYIDISNIPAEDYYKVFTSAQVEAKFPGDWNKFLERNLNAQVPSDKGAPSGRYSVTVSFLVDTTGKISEIKAENDPGYGTAQEAVRVIKNGPDWQPAIQNGKKVIYRQKQTIVFEVTKE